MIDYREISFWLDVDLGKLNIDAEDHLSDFIMGKFKVCSVLTHTDVLITIDCLGTLEETNVEAIRIKTGAVKEYNRMIKTKKWTE